MGHYYTLGAELPELKLEQNYLDFTLVEVWEKMQQNFSRGDLKQMQLLFLEEDNKILLKLLRGEEYKDVYGLTPHAIEIDRLRELIEYLNKRPEDDDLKLKAFRDIPDYMLKFSHSYLKGEYEEHQAFPEDILQLLYYKHVEDKGKGFLKRWFEFNTIISNVLAAHTAKKFDLDLRQYIIGESELAELLKRSSLTEIDALDNADLVKHLIKIGEENKLYQKEKRLDALRWDYLDSCTFSDIFSLEAMMAYYLKTRIIQRWLSLDKEKGEKVFRQMIKSLNAEGQDQLNLFVKKQNSKKQEQISY